MLEAINIQVLCTNEEVIIIIFNLDILIKIKFNIIIERISIHHMNMFLLILIKM